MYNSNINLNLYKTFYDVAHYGSLMAASKNLLISQPAISRSIKKLESDLNVTLFYRTLNGMILTDKGRELLAYVEDACNSLIIGERNILEGNDINHGKLTIGINEFYSYLIIDIIKDFTLKYPDVKLSIISRNSKDLVELLNNHEVDFIIDANKVNDNNIRNILLCQNNYHFVKLKNDIKINNVDELNQYRIIMPSDKNNVVTKLGLNKEQITYIDAKEIMYNLLDNNSVIYIKESDLLDNMEIIDIEECETMDVNVIFNDKYILNVPRIFIKDYLKLDI